MSQEASDVDVQIAAALGRARGAAYYAARDSASTEADRRRLDEELDAAIDAVRDSDQPAPEKLAWLSALTETLRELPVGVQLQSLGDIEVVSDPPVNVQERVPPKTRRGWLGWFTNLAQRAHNSPIISLSGWILTIIATLLYVVDKNRVDLAYCESPTRSTIVGSAAVSGLRVQFNGRDIRGGVSSVKLLIWNRGTQPIRASDFRERIRIIARPEVDILQAQIEKQSNRYVGFQIVEPTMRSELPLTWTMLERGEAAMIQIVYAGPREAAFRIVGAIAGQRVPNRRDYESLQPVTWKYLLGRLWPAGVMLLQLLTLRRRQTRAFVLGAILVLLVWGLWTPIQEGLAADPDFRF